MLTINYCGLRFRLSKPHEGACLLSCHVGDRTEMGKRRAKSRVKGASRVNGPSKPPTAKNLAAQFKIPALEKVSGGEGGGGSWWVCLDLSG